MEVAEVVINSAAKLAEGVFWHEKEEKLYWVDIKNKELHRFDPQSQKDVKIDLPQRIGTVVPIEGGGLLVGLQNCIARVDSKLRSVEMLVDLEPDIPDNRCNDGKCDPAGRFWVGTMDLEAKPFSGNLYRIEGTYSVTKVLTDLSISNGIVWSSDKETMFLIDSPTYSVQAFDYDHKTGSISNKRTVVEIPEEIGLPDGMTRDNEDMLWIAHWGGFCVGRWDPDTGKLLRKIKVPVPNVTNCAFGGFNLDRLYITTARAGLSKEDLKKYPESGSVFDIDLDVQGVPPNYFNPIEPCFKI